MNKIKANNHIITATIVDTTINEDGERFFDTGIDIPKNIKENYSMSYIRTVLRYAGFSTKLMNEFLIIK